jgi:hypothetical protein
MSYFSIFRSTNLPAPAGSYSVLRSFRNPQEIQILEIKKRIIMRRRGGLARAGPWFSKLRPRPPPPSPRCDRPCRCLAVYGKGNGSSPIPPGAVQCQG